MMHRTPRRDGTWSLSSIICALGVAVGGVSPSTASELDPILVVDAMADPGVDLLVTFVPQTSVEGGVRRVAAHQFVVTTVPLHLSATRPAFWMVSVLKVGDVAANISTRPVSEQNGHMVFGFPDEMTVTLVDGEWQLPNYDSNRFLVDVGFGIGSDIVQPAYSVRCRPAQRIRMAPGSYQLVRSDGDDTTGRPIPPDLEAWNVPPNTDSILMFNARGQGTLNPLR